MERRRHVFLTGPPGVGKSTIIAAVHRRLASAAQCQGFYTVEQLDAAGQRIGFRSIALHASSVDLQLATTAAASGATSSARNMIGPFRVHVDEMEKFYCDEALVGGCKTKKPRLMIMDEVGAMQLLSPRVEALFGRWLGSSHCLGTIPPAGLHHGLDFVEAIRRRADTAIFEVTEENRAILPEVIASLLYRILFGRATAALIEQKAALATRYVTELDRRLRRRGNGSRPPPRRFHPSSSVGAHGGGRGGRAPLASHAELLDFVGDHGVYQLSRLKKGKGQGAYECSCPFFEEHGTCSHTLALAMGAERMRRTRGGGGGGASVR